MPKFKRTLLQTFYYKKNQNNSKNALNKLLCNESSSESPTSILLVWPKIKKSILQCQTRSLLVAFFVCPSSSIQNKCYIYIYIVTYGIIRVVLRYSIARTRTLKKGLAER